MNRPHDTELVVETHLSQWFVQMVTRGASGFLILLGLVILIGGPIRFTGLGYRAASAIPFSPYSWAIFAIVAGTLVGYGAMAKKVRLTAIGTALGGMWCAFFSGAFWQSAINSDTAGTTGIVVYGAFAFAYAFLTGVYHAMDPFPWRQWGRWTVTKLTPWAR